MHSAAGLNVGTKYCIQLVLQQHQQQNKSGANKILQKNKKTAYATLRVLKLE